VQSLVPISTVA